MTEKVKKTTQGGQDHFGAHGAFDKETAQEGEFPQLSVAELDGYFSSLTNVATTEKEILAALVKSNANKATSNASLTTPITDLQKKLTTIGNNPCREPTRQRRNCPNFKKEVYHLPDD